MNNQTSAEKQFTDALKSIARHLEIKSYIQQSPELYRFASRAAKRFVTGEERVDGITAGKILLQKGYAVSLEYIGENTASAQECRRAAGEFAELVRDCGQKGMPSRISLDLSHIGLSVDPELAYAKLVELAQEAEKHGMHIIISMEESAKTDLILSVYKKAAAHYANIGITLQAHLYRTPEDLAEILSFPGWIRIVKGAYQEPADCAMPRGDELNQRYVELVESCVKAGHPVSIASHDEKIIAQIIERGYLQQPQVELEMLYGIRSDLGKRLKEAGFPVRIYLTYGEEWYLYLCHRIAEYPPNLYVAVTDMINGAKTTPSLY